MGLIKAISNSIGGTLSDAWKEYFYCDCLNNDILVARGQKKIREESSNNKSEENIITSGSKLVINDGQSMLIVEQGKIKELCNEPGEYIYDNNKTASIFSENTVVGVANTFKSIGERIGYGGNAPLDQRIYYFNVKEIVENKFGTVTPIPFRIVDKSLGLDLDVSIRCNGIYSYKIINPILFYKNVCGNVIEVYSKTNIEMQMKTELLSAMQLTFGKLSNLGLRPNEIVSRNKEIEESLNIMLTEKWKEKRGIEIVSFSISSFSLPDKDQDMIKQIQKNAIFRDTTMAAANLVGAQADAMRDAANNKNGSINAFLGLGMAMNIASNHTVNGLYNIENDKHKWTCERCGTINFGKFCSNCGKKYVGEKI